MLARLLRQQDCECNPGYVIRYTGNSQGYCERYEGSNGGGGYQCPSNSHRIPGRRNNDNFLVSRTTFRAASCSGKSSADLAIMSCSDRVSFCSANRTASAMTTTVAT